MPSDQPLAGAPPPVVVNIHPAPPVAAPTIVVSDGRIVIGDSGSASVAVGPHLTGMERLAVFAAIIVGTLMALTITPVRVALLVLLPLPVLAYAWWLYAGEPRGSRLWSALGDSLPGADALTPRQRRAVTALLVVGGIWVAIFLVNYYAGAPAPGSFI